VTDGTWSLHLSARAHKRLADPKGLPKSVAAVLGAFIAGPLLSDPYGEGKALTGDLRGLRSARRGVYRILYRVDAGRRTVFVLRVEHRSEVYRHQRR
jgi:mRNA-degrading endonuclease RelE of RelBE toxin-antitoxin system